MTTFTDAVYDSTKMGTPSPLIYSLSASNNNVVIQSTGKFQEKDVVGILFNSADFTTTPASATTVTLSSPGETTTVVRLSGLGPTGATLGLINFDRFSTTFTATTASTTVVVRTSAGDYGIIDPNRRRLKNLTGL